MTISMKNYNPRQVAGIDKISSIKSGLPAAVDDRNVFGDLLQNCLKEMTSTGAGAALPPLDKDQVALIVKSIQIQMSRQLFKAVFNNGAEVNFSPSGFLPNLARETSQPLIEASKNRQISPKNDINQNISGLDTFINKAAIKYDVDPDLIRAVIKTESNFNSQAISAKGAMGLMQLMPETARDLGVKNAYDPEENIMGGTRYLRTLLSRYDGNVDAALAAYNWGMGNVERSPQQLPRETSTYVARVNTYYKNHKASA